MTPSKQKWQYRVVDGKTIIDSEMIVYRFEVDWDLDVTIAAAAPIYEWEQSEAGKWVMEHAVEIPRWERFEDVHGFTVKFAVVARLAEQDQIVFRLKFE